MISIPTLAQISIDRPIASFKTSEVTIDAILTELIFNVDGFRTFHAPAPGGGGIWVFFGWVCAVRDSKLTPRSKKISPKIHTPF